MTAPADIDELERLHEKTLHGVECQANREFAVAVLAAAPELIAEVRRLRWQPIETAPKDGTDILVVGADGVRTICFWGDCLGTLRRKGQRRAMAWCIPWSEDGEQGTYQTVDDATHWMPLPSPPEVGQE